MFLLNRKRISVLWDIDGTLLTTNRAGIIAFELAVQEVFECKVELSSLKTAGLVDFEVAKIIIDEFVGVSVTESALRDLIVSYENHLPTCLPMKQGHTIPGVNAILENLKYESDIASYLLTGNTSRGARAKLTYYQMNSYFDNNGFFCEIGENRSDIGLRAKKFFQEDTWNPSVDHSLFLVGDTPHDISCGKLLNAKTIVLTTNYIKNELAYYNPWMILESFPSPEDFIALLKEAT